MKNMKASPRSKRAGILPLLAPILAIAAIPIFAGSMLLLTGFLADFYVESFLDLAIETPGFDYEIDDGVEKGNATFGVYTQMRLMAVIALVCLIIGGTVFRVFEARDPESDIVSSRTVSTTVTKPLMLIILFFAFPIMWDIGSDITEDVGLWILNPLYSFDPDRPCPDEWYEDTQIIIDAHNESKYTRGGDAALYDVERAESVCRPELRSNYLIRQAVQTTEYEEYKPPDPLTSMFRMVTTFTIGGITNMFFLFMKAIVATNLVISTMLALILTDVITGVAIAALPLFASLSMIPKYSKLSEQFISVVPAILLLPILTAIMLVVGSSFVASANEQDVGFIQDTGVLELGLFYTWVASIGVLYMVAGLPAMMVGMIGNILSRAQQTVMHSVNAAMFVTSMVTGGANSAVKDRVIGKDANKDGGKDDGNGDDEKGGKEDDDKEEKPDE